MVYFCFCFYFCFLFLFLFLFFLRCSARSIPIYYVMLQTHTIKATVSFKKFFDAACIFRYLDFFGDKLFFFFCLITMIDVILLIHVLFFLQWTERTSYSLLSGFSRCRQISTKERGRNHDCSSFVFVLLNCFLNS